MEHPPNVLNILTAAFGALSTSFSGFFKWRDYAGKATFHEDAVSFYEGGINKADHTLQASKQPSNYPPNKLLKAKRDCKPSPGKPRVAVCNQKKHQMEAFGCWSWLLYNLPVIHDVLVFLS